MSFESFLSLVQCVDFIGFINFLPFFMEEMFQFGRKPHNMRLPVVHVIHVSYFS